MSRLADMSRLAVNEITDSHPMVQLKTTPTPNEAAPYPALSITIGNTCETHHRPAAMAYNGYSTLQGAVAGQVMQDAPPTKIDLNMKESG
jgi:hypothetical protein